MTVTVVIAERVYSVVLEYDGDQGMLQADTGAAAWTTAA